MDAETEEILHCFVDECRDAIMVIESLLEWLEEESPEDRDETFAEIFRRIHSMKGSAGYLNLNTIQRVAHRTEGLLLLMMGGSVPTSESMLDTLSLAVDFIAERLEVVVVRGTDGGTPELENRLLSELNRAIANGPHEPSKRTAEVELDRVIPAADLVGGRATRPEGLSPGQVAVFVRETEVLLGTMSTSLDGLVSRPSDEVLLMNLYRSLQSFRSHGEALMLSPLTHLAHVMEESVAGFLDAPISPEPELLTTLSEASQMLQKAVGDLEETGGPVHVDGLSDLLTKMRFAGGAMDDSDASGRLGEMLVDAGYISPLVLSVARSRAATGDGVEEILMDMEFVDPRLIEVARGVDRELRLGRAARMPKATAQDRLHETIRVDVGLVDELSRLVDSLPAGEREEVQEPTHELIRQLRETVYRVRMSTLKSTLRRMRRMVADVAVKRSKKVRLVISGEEIEVERRLVEVIADSLVHLLRNAVDHGIEGADVRSQQGKSLEGLIRVVVFKSKEKLSVQVSDDGRGLNTDRIYQRALTEGLTTKARNQISDSEIFALVFQSGVSTAATVSDISGRGVGLDVVRLKVEAVGGEVRVRSRPGVGTEMELWFPLQQIGGES